jgi:6-phosphogluconolactonase (cycloisomerase 2 family)
VVPLDPAHGGLIEAFVTNAGSNNVSAYVVAGDGGLTPVVGSSFPVGEAPSSLDANYNIYPVPFLFVANSKSNDISVFSVDDSTGVLTAVAGSPFPSGGTAPSSIAVGGSQFVGFGGLNGPYVYVANAGSNNMSVFVADLGTGVLTPVDGSPFPVGTSPSAVLYFQSPE